MSLVNGYCMFVNNRALHLIIVPSRRFENWPITFFTLILKGRDRCRSIGILKGFRSAPVSTFHDQCEESYRPIFKTLWGARLLNEGHDCSRTYNREKIIYKPEPPKWFCLRGSESSSDIKVSGSTPYQCASPYSYMLTGLYVNVSHVLLCSTITNLHFGPKWAPIN